HLDITSLLAEVRGDATLAAIEAELATHGLTLGLDPGAATAASVTVDAWIASGAPGARDPWRDPVDHLLAGFDARLTAGLSVRVRPAPRRAAGPDPPPLLLGPHRRFGTVMRAHLRVHRKSQRRPESPSFDHERDPPMTAGEEALLDAVARELAT